MARVINVSNVKDLVQSQTKQYVADATGSYAHFLETAPTFVTYYSRNYLASTEDPHLEAYNQIVGTESPNKFTKIENFPVYGLEIADFGSDLTDVGWRSNVETSCIILPNSITPNTEDQILLEYDTKKWLFTVTTSSSDNMNKAKFYKLTLKLDNQTHEEIEKQVVKELGVDYSLIGTKRNFLIELSLLEQLDELRSKYDKLLADYRSRYYSDRGMVFFDDLCIDQYLNYFIWNNDLQVPFLNYRNTTTINRDIQNHIDLDIYDDSLFGKLELRNTDFSKVTTNVGQAEFDKREGYMSFLYFLRTKYHLVEYGEEHDFALTSLGKFLSYYNRLSNDLLNEARGDKDVKDLPKVDRLLARFLDTIKDTSSDFTKSKELLEDILSTRISLDKSNSSIYERNAYYDIPLVLFFMKQTFNKLTK